MDTAWISAFSAVMGEEYIKKNILPYTRLGRLIEQFRAGAGGDLRPEPYPKPTACTPKMARYRLLRSSMFIRPAEGNASV
jgi:hypothetical protein